MIKEAIVLAGGLGTRLKSITGDAVPKPMVSVAGKPFLHHLFVQLKRWNVEHVILSVGHRHEVIQNFFAENYLGMRVSYSIESEPLGTGGAIKQALQTVNNESCFILNGDSYFNTAFDALEDFSALKNADMVMALKPVENSNRYGTVKLNDEHRVTAFEEKRFVEHGIVNAGVYCASRSLLDKLPLQNKFSFEEDYLKPFALRDKIYGVVSDAYFIDVGIPEDYKRADKEFGD